MAPTQNTALARIQAARARDGDIQANGARRRLTVGGCVLWMSTARIPKASMRC
ncbi:MAG TPA: hypothetical protein VGL81_03430 [Polyangiaceae bacterium]|jgi:hypothetical protein